MRPRELPQEEHPDVKSLLQSCAPNYIYSKYYDGIRYYPNPGQDERYPGKELNEIILIATLNISTIRGRSNETVKIMLKRQKEIYCVQEPRWRG